MKNFIGQKLKCVDDSPPETFKEFESLKKGETYIVKQILNKQDLKVEGSEYGWNKNRFIPLENNSDMSSNWYLAHFRTFEETNLKSNAKYLTKIFFKCICNIHTTIKRTYRTNLFNIFRFNITGFVLISKY